MESLENNQILMELTMYRKILIGLLVSTAAIHSMESSEEQQFISQHKTNGAYHPTL
jgi:hypothetical protein